MKAVRKTSLIWSLTLFVFSLAASAQTTGFVYQGSLKDGANTANGSYDFEFALFDSVSGGTQIGTTLPRNGVPVSDGRFTVDLDFGPAFPGTARFLEIRVRTAGGGPFAVLEPRQPISSTPYSVRSIDAATATNALQLGGVAANQYVLTGDVRLSDARNPLPGSPNYVQNTTAQQATSNFNISGDGTVGGTMTGSIVRANTQFNIGTNRVLRTQGFNTFLGIESGPAATVGVDNSFFGYQAGRVTNGSFNSFFGTGSGNQHTDGSRNSFFGSGSGNATTTGGNNSFFGERSGLGNTIGSNNTLVGAGANVASGNLSFATAIGSGAVATANNTVVLGRVGDTVQIPGVLNASGTFSGNGNGLTDLNAGNIQTGTLDPARLGNGAILNQTTQQPASNFNISGDGEANGTLAANIVRAKLQFNIGTNRVLNVLGSNNIYVGIGAGAANPQGNNNAFFGAGAGQINTANFNAFFGAVSGSSNTLGSANSFFGASSGLSNTDGTNNSFFGSSSGVGNLTGSFNTASGYNARFGAGSLTNATAIGANAQVDSSNALVLGSIAGVNGATADTNVGIGTTDPQTNLHVEGTTWLTQGNLVLRTNVTGSAGRAIIAERSRGTASAPTAVLAGDSLIRFEAFGFNGSGYPGVTSMRILAAEDFSATGAGTRIAFRTTQLGTLNTIRSVMNLTDSGVSVMRGEENTAPHSFVVGNGTNLNVASADIAIFGANGAYATIQDTTADVQALFGADASVSGMINGAAIYGAMTPHGIMFRTNNSNRMVITHPDGNVGIGTTNPVDRIDVLGDIRIGTGTTGCVKDRDGTIVAGTCSSDLRLKQSINGLESVLERFSRLRPVTFNWRSEEFKNGHFGTRRSFGLIAQEVEMVFPDLVSMDEQGFKAVNYSKLPLITIQAVNELKSENDALRSQVETQNLKIDRQQAEIDALKRFICAQSPAADLCKGQ